MRVEVKLVTWVTVPDDDDSPEGQDALGLAFEAALERIRREGPEGVDAFSIGDVILD